MSGIECSVISPMFVTVVEDEACRFCAEAAEVLVQLAEDYPLVVRTIGIRTPEGDDLMRRHGAVMTPLVLADGKVFSQGRLPQRMLRRLLADRYDTALSEPAG